MMRVALSLVLLGAAAGQSCTDKKETGKSCPGDKYEVGQASNADDCCAACAADDKCVQWSYHPGFLGIFPSHCYKSSTQEEPTSKGGSTCGRKSSPTPPSPPPSPPSPPSPPAPGAQHHWAVIIAGSNTYSNYRHQADACHAYQIAKKNGIPESQIILLAYDDIANSRSNPFKGKMFNKPDGPDVYEGCKISYKGHDVNKENFLKVLTGDTSASGPVLKSTKEDKVFVYFADHGGVGILGVPTGAAGGYIHATDVNNALETMHSKGMYKELLFYVEACESGSIFKGLLKAPNVVAVTAANAKESSWGFYCPPQDKVNGKSIGSCLGDEFSIRWMEDSDVANFKSETVKQQVDKVTSLVKKSHVQQFGDMSTIGGEVIGDFEGGLSASVVSMATNVTASSPSNGLFAVNSRDIEVHLAYSELEQAETMADKRAAQVKLRAVLSKRQAIDDLFMQIAMAAMDGDSKKAQAMIDGDLEELGNAMCHKKAMEVTAESCGPFGDYSMRYSRLFANLCNMAASPFVTVDAAVKKVCKGAEKSETIV